MLTPLPARARAILFVCRLSVTATSLAAEGSSPSPHGLVPRRPFCEFRQFPGSGSVSDYATTRPLGRAGKLLWNFARRRPRFDTTRLAPAVQDEVRLDHILSLLSVVPERVCDFQFFSVPFSSVGRNEPHEHSSWSPSAIVVACEGVIGNKSSERYYSVERPIMDI